MEISRDNRSFIVRGDEQEEKEDKNKNKSSPERC